MCNYMDHLLVLNELSASYLRHAARKAGHLASAANNDSINLWNRMNIANTYGHTKSRSEYYNRAHDAQAYSDKKSAQAKRLKRLAKFKAKIEHSPALNVDKWRNKPY